MFSSGFRIDWRQVAPHMKTIHATLAIFIAEGSGEKHQTHDPFMTFSFVGFPGFLASQAGLMIHQHMTMHGGHCGCRKLGSGNP